jgi:CheY-like chemotaxis protein
MDHLSASRFVALTGWGTDGDRDRAKAAGFDAHLTKPAGMEEINGLLAALSA